MREPATRTGWLADACVFSFCLVFSSLPVAAADTQSELAELRAEVQALRQEQKELRNELAELSKRVADSAPAASEGPPPTTRRAPEPFQPRELEIGEAPFKGAPDAPVQLIAYNDYQCTYCARHSRQTMPELTAHFLDSGKLKLVMREFPIPNLGPRAEAAAQAAVCAADAGGYWEMHDLLFENQRRLADSDLRGYAAGIGIDSEVFARCLDSEHVKDRIQHDIEEGLQLGVRATPSFALGLTNPSDPDKVTITRMVVGARDFEFFATEINALLTAAAQAREDP